MNQDARAVVIGASSTLGRALLPIARSCFADVIPTFWRHPMQGARPFQLGRNRLSELRPLLRQGDWLVLLAAATSPDWIHTHPLEADRDIFQPLCALVQEANALGLPILFFSSELVFDGERGGYTENDPTSPTTAYGRQKVELETQILARDGLVVRTGALVTDGLEDNCVVRKTFESLLRPGARFAHDAQLSLTHVDDLLRISINLLTVGQRGLFHVAGSPIDRVDLARRVFESSRFGPCMAFETIPFSDLIYPEPRPQRSWLSSNRLDAALRNSLRKAEVIVPPKVALLDAAWMDHISIPQPKSEIHA